MVGFVPREMFFTKGVGKHREKLTSFELALRSAGIAACNLVRVSSIFPPKCRILSRTHGMKRLAPGQVTFVVMSEAATRELGLFFKPEELLEWKPAIQTWVYDFGKGQAE